MEFMRGTKRWAIQKMLEGTKVRRLSWGPSEYIFIDKEGVILEENDREINIRNLDCDCWEIYKGPKKVTYYKYIYVFLSAPERLFESPYTQLTFDKYQPHGNRRLLETETREFEVPNEK